MAHVTGASRYQATLFPEVLDEVVGPDDPVRVIDAFVETLDLAALGFSKVAAEEMGRPPYAPGDLLKLYIYGYLHRIRASRRLEAETHRNVQVMWLLNRLTPAFKTIADFRKDHVEAIVGVCRAFIRFCREQSLFGAELLAIDGTKIAAVASRKQVMTPKRIKKMNAAIDRKIAEYLASMDEADREEPGSAGKPADIAAAIEALKAQKARLQGQAEDLAARGLKQMVMTEREAKLMRTPHGHAVAYNAQTAVDVEHKLIVAFDLTNEGNDYRQLHPMAVQGKAAVGADEVTVVADTGYSNGEHGALCERDGITAIVPRAETVNPNGAQYFSRDRFSYDRESDSWRCPAGATLSLFKTSHTQKKKEYTSRSCGSCALKPQCTEAARRVIVRDFYEDAREAMHRRATDEPVWMKHRRETVEHPFGTMKWLMAHPRFLIKGLKKAKAELAPGVLCYNLKRVISILGVPALLEALEPSTA
ncbi:IS1182 family transposase [Bradyrhizobium sp.]|uniref:IS1182 family transposase n=1 Tax=Bradyrhizobium sp. TaxID=376 RepID=UPI00271E6469|nr:IS1182 family transposase [Bradyrhizobium sp.]MDO9298366.1 IS1182 family transposase [Bradyrhizobium sp.]